MNNLNLLSQLFTKKFSLIEVSYVALPVSISLSFLYTLYELNQKMIALTQNVQDLQNNISLLREANAALEDALGEKSAEISSLIGQLKQQDVASLSDNVVVDSSVIMANNEMTQFYIKSLGVVVLCVGAVFLLNYMMPASFGWKSFLPTSVYSWVQDKTIFFQDRRPFSYFDQPTDTQWIVTIVNDKFVELQVKSAEAADFVSVSDYLLKLQTDAGMLVTTTDSALQIVTNPEVAVNTANLVNAAANLI